MSAINARASRRRGVSGDLTRQLLNALREPGRMGDLTREFGWTESEAHALLKHAHEQGWVTRLQRGVYQLSEAGEQALAGSREVGIRFLSRQCHQPPEGTGWTPERKAWLDTFYARLGHHRCAELLGSTPGAVHGMARKRGLQYGDVSGYTLLTDLAAMTGQAYQNLYTCALRAGMLTFPGPERGREVRQKAMVPDSWAEELVGEMHPPTPEDVALAELRRDIGLSQTQAARKAAGHSYLRTPVQGGQSRLYVSQDFAQQLRLEYARRRRIPKTPEIGRDGYRQAYAARGQEGATERELFESLGTSRAAVRSHTRALLQAGELQRCRAGNTLDPYVYRLVEFAGQPEPQQRQVVIKGRPKKIRLQEAAD